MGNMSGVIKTGLFKALYKCLPFRKLRAIFKSTNRLKSCFNIRDVLPELLRSCQIYKFTCGSCSASYTGKIFWHLKVRVSEHQGVSFRTGKIVKGTLYTSVRDHMLECNNIVTWDDFKVWGESQTTGFWRLRRVYSLKETNHYLIKIFTLRNCFYFNFKICVLDIYSSLFREI